jgi:hypothetical protein
MQKHVYPFTVKAGAVLAGLLLFSTLSFGQRNWSVIDTSGFHTVETITKKKFTLIFINKDSLFSSVTKQRMIDAFFKVYPAEVKRFNKKSLRKVTFLVDSSYKGVAATSNGIVRYNPSWLEKHPEDIDVVTHELMHIVQSYPRGGEGWLTEGIADYVRFKFGVNNEKGNWSLPAFKETQSYTNSYRITARFLVWIEKNVRKTLVNEMDEACRKGEYTPELWEKLTGKTVAELWADYAASPAI